MRALIWLAISAAAACAAPVIRDIHPHGAERGRTFTLALRGDGLPNGAKLQTTLPAGISRLAPKDGELPFLVELKADAPIGLYPIRLLTDDGISNVVLFAVGNLPESEEAEKKNPKQTNNTPETAEQLPIPGVMNGTLTAADQDYYWFQAKAGQKLVFEVEARRAGSAIDPAIEILDASGNLVAKNDDAPGIGVDCRMEVNFSKAGRYCVRIHDSKYSDQAVNFYRLKAGWWPYADALYPLGGRAGTEVTLAGGNLKEPVKVPAARFVNVPGSSSLPLPFALSDDPNIKDGLIAKPGQIDKQRIAVKAGEQWIFEVQAASLGTSQLDGILSVYDTAGKKLASRDDTAGADPVLPFTVPKGVNEVVVAIEDVLGRGGPGFGYRFQAQRRPPDFLVDLATPFVNVPAGGTAQVVAIVQRRGYDGPVRLTIPNLPKGFHQAGGHVPSEAAAQSFNNDNAGFRTARSVITITADPDVPQQVLELNVVGVAEAAGGRIERQARGPGVVTPVRGPGQRAFTAPWLGMALPMGIAKSLPVNLRVPIPSARIAQGFEWTMPYRIERRSGAKAPGKIRDQIAGSVGNLRILKTPPGKNPDAGAVLVATNFATPATVFDMVFEAETEVDGRPMTITSPAVEIDVVEGYRVQLDKTEFQIAPGSEVRIRGKVFREPTFEGSVVRIRAEDLPERMNCAPIEVPEDQREFELSCQAPREVAAGSYQIRLTSAAPDTGRKAKDEYKIPDVTAKLTVSGAVHAAR